MELTQNNLQAPSNSSFEANFSRKLDKAFINIFILSHFISSMKIKDYPFQNSLSL